MQEFRLDLVQEDAHGVTVVIYGCSDQGQWQHIADSAFGPFDTCTDIAQWTIRHVAPRLKLPLR